ncbi:hypothetical protein SP99_02007 [Enterobacter sp. BIDMC92]|uniref:hypothetical protein n=1 Tax=Enterobacter sp. BIDMC92 TaxID=1594172 RepID=UPI000659013B|nr:hypothetical protein [Enterobacter sp. BIDMC92]KLW91787.1 hypothetical protein SP99_02007 [Enterobacter sp. BIDMC92]
MKHEVVDKRFGRLTVDMVFNYRADGDHSKPSSKWCIASCDCGGCTMSPVSNLKKGHTLSCGCYQVAAAKVYAFKHGQAQRGNKSPTYKSWQAMHNRCRYPSTDGYEYYGGRGISVCPEWSDFKSFLAYMGERPEGKTLDRINPNGNYEPSNCRWATPKEQKANQRK